MTNTPAELEDEIIAALTAAGRPMRAQELTAAVLGGDTHPDWMRVQSRLWSMCRHKVLVRIGTATRGSDAFHYCLPAASGAPQKAST